MNTPNAMQNAMTDAAGFHEGSTTDAEEIDHGLVGQNDLNLPGDNEVPQLEDTAAKDETNQTEPQAVEAPKQTGGKAPTPSFVFENYYWADKVNKATGQVTWRLNALPDVVAYTVSRCDDVMSNAYADLSDEDKVLANDLAQSLKLVVGTSTNIDQWLANTVIYAYSSEAGRSIAIATKFALAAEDARRAGRKENATTLDNSSKSAGRNAAIIKLALISASDAEVNISYSRGAWDAYGREAYKFTNKYMNPDEKKDFDTRDRVAGDSSSLLRQVK